MRQDQAYAVTKKQDLGELVDTMQTLDRNWRQRVERQSEQAHIAREAYRDAMRDSIKFDKPYPTPKF